MKKAIGLVELKSTPIGIQTADEMVKAANVELVLANPVCPGKYMIVVSGDVGAVKNSVERGKSIADVFLVESHIINNVSPQVLVAIAGATDIKDLKSIGAIETISALTIIKAADIAVKASNVQLIEVRIAKGLGGKGFLIMTGEISSVKSAIKSCENELAKLGEITSTSIIASPLYKIGINILRRGMTWIFIKHHL